jgi:hypothetical protein
MEKKLVTCPETAHIEEIRYLADRDGEILVVLRCTRFDPPADIQCDATCAQRMNCRVARARTQTLRELA